jgi:hypothetical protein
VVDPRSVGMTFLGRVMPPVLFSRQRQRLPALLTHKLSHAHLGSWMSQLGFWRLPQWFKEGLAVLVSGGGGAEGVSVRIPTMATPSLGCMATPYSGVATCWGWCERHHWGVGHLSVERFGQARRRPSP